MDAVRQAWGAGMVDTGALRAFRLCGTPDDIPALRQAAEDYGLPEEPVGQAVEAILDRHRQPSVSRRR